MRAKTKSFRLLLICLISILAGSAAFGFTYILNSDTGLPTKWNSGQIVMRVMADNTTKLTDGNTRAGAIVIAMNDALRGWNQYLGDAQFSPQILAVGNGSDGNNINEVFFSDKPYDKSWDDNTLAITTDWSAGNERTEADTIFNTAFTWDSYRGALNPNGAIDIERVALHEFGHNLGLDHPDEASPKQDVTAVMNSHVGFVDSLQADDITGAQNLYGPPGVPANDNFANAIAIVLDNNDAATVTGFNTNATKEAGEPNHANNPGGHSVWWKWTALSSGAVTLDTRGSYSDTTLGVYTGSSVSALTTIASNDDIKDGVIQASSLTFTAVAGTTYYIAVDGFKATDSTGADLGTDSSGITVNLSLVATGGTIPVITAQPVNQTVTAGNIASFSVTATSTATITYQWYFNNAAIAGATSSTFNIGNAQAANAGSYYVTASNNVGPATSSTATLTVNPAPVTPPKSGGGGGGGAPSLWFWGALSLLGASRRLFRSRR